MENFEDRKLVRRDNIKQKKGKSSLMISETAEKRKKVKSFKQKKQSYTDDETWEEWQEYYK